MSDVLGYSWETYVNFTPSGKLSPAFNGCGAASSGEVLVDMVGSLHLVRLENRMSRSNKGFH